MKTIILLVQDLNGLAKCIEKNLKYHDYNVIYISYHTDKHYPTLSSRIKAFFYKIINKAKYKSYKRYLDFTFFEKEINDKLNNITADFALCIRPNAFPEELIVKIKEHSKKCIGYQWDGLDRYPDIFDYIHYFDKFYVFDKADIKKYTQYPIKLISNFYFDYLEFDHAQDNNIGAYFVGGHLDSRVIQINNLLDFFEKNGINTSFYLMSNRNKAEKAFNNDKRIIFLDDKTPILYEKNLEFASKSFVLIDFVNPIHNGLSFRVFESLKFNKKLITTNKSIKEYDFYHPNNIFILDKNNINEITNFLHKPYYTLDKNIVYKYSFNNWITQILE